MSTFNLDGLDDLDLSVVPDQKSLPAQQDLGLNVQPEVESIVPDKPLRQVFEEANKEDPERFVKINEFTAASDLSRPLIESAFEQLEEQARLDKQAPADGHLTHPTTTQFLSNYGNAVLAQNDTELLREIEDYFAGAKKQDQYDKDVDFVVSKLTGPTTLRNNLALTAETATDLFGAGVSAVNQAGTAINDAFDLPAVVIDDGKGKLTLPHFISNEEFKQRKARDPEADLAVLAANALKDVTLGYEKRYDYNNFANAYKNGNLSDVISTTIQTGLETTAGSIPHMLAAAYSLPLYVPARAEQLGQARAKNKGLQEATIRETLEAAPGALASALFERILPNRIFKGKTSSEIATIQKEVAGKIKEVVKRAGEGVAIEAATEFLQEGVIEYLTERVGTDAKLDIQEALQKGWEGAVLGGVSGGGLAGGTTVVNELKTIKPSQIIRQSQQKVIDQAEVAPIKVETDSDQDSAELEGLQEKVEGLTLNQTSPETIADFIEKADGDNNSQVYIDAGKVEEYLATQNVATTNDPVVQSLDRGLQETFLSGGEVAIPVAEAAQLLASPEHFQSLQDAITLKAETVPQFRKQEAVDATRQYAEKVVEAANTTESRYVEAQNIAEKVKDQLIETGRLTPDQAATAAQIAPAWAAAYAERNNISIEQAFEKSGLTIEGPNADRKKALKKRKGELEADGVVFNQGGGKVKGTFDPARSLIQLTEASDLSTFLHEFGHFIYEQELNAESALSQENVKAIHKWIKRNIKDVAKNATKYGETEVSVEQVAEYIDKPDGTGDAKVDRGVQIAIHEYVAEGFEQYLLEGKAPTVELRNAFASFTRWLTQIYKGIKGGLDTNLDNEARELFDKLLATDEQIEAAQARAQFDIEINDAVLQGMTPEQYKKYLTNKERGKDQQAETLRDKVLTSLRKQHDTESKERLKVLTVEEETKLQDDKVYKAIRVLKTEGKLKLDLASTKAEHGVDVENKSGFTSRRLPTAFNNMTASGKRGVHADQAADLLGFSSGRELIESIRDAVPISEQAKVNAKQRLNDEFGDPLNDGTIEALADEAIQVEGRGEALIQELKSLRGPRASTLQRQEYQDIAKHALKGKDYTELHPAKYRAAELRHAQEFAKATAEGDTTAAIVAKKNQTLHHFLAVEAAEARQAIEKFRDFTARYGKKSVRTTIAKGDVEGTALTQIDKILQRFELRKSASIKSVESLNAWAETRRKENLEEYALSPYVLEEGNKSHWKKVPFEELMGVQDSLKSIEHIARENNKLQLEEETLDFEEAVTGLVNGIDANLERKDKFKSSRQSSIHGVDKLRRAVASLTKIPYLTNWLDNGERGGSAHKLISQPFTDAQDKSLQLWKEVAEPVVKAIQNRSKSDIARHNRSVTIESWGTDNKIYVHQILALALNTGNQQNLEKVMIGEGWADKSDYGTGRITRDNQQMNDAFQHLTKADWELVQTVWSQMELLYPQVAETSRKATGVIPPKVKSLSFTNEYGTFEGGYYPLVPDVERSKKAALNDARLQEISESSFGSFSNISASVNAGSVNARTEAFYPVRLSLDVIPTHFNETIHYVTHQQAVKQTLKIVTDGRVQDAITETLGKHEYELFKPWLKDIASQARSADPKSFLDETLTRVKNGTTLTVMGFNMTTGIVQGLGLSNAVAEVGLLNMGRGMKHVLGGGEKSMGEAYDFAMSESKILKHRVKTMDREMLNALNALQGQQNVKSGRKLQDALTKFDNLPFLKKMQQVSMSHIAYIQLYGVDLPTWYGAYTKELGKSGDEGKAVRVADATVESIQGSGSMKDMAALMRSKKGTTQIFTMFMTFFSAAWNFQRDTVKLAKNKNIDTGDKVVQLATRIGFGLVIPVIAEELLRSALTGALGDDNDENNPTPEKLAAKMVLYPVTGVPGLRDLAASYTSDFGFNMSPVQSVLESGLQANQALFAALFSDEKEITQRNVEGTTKLAGTLLRVPGAGAGVKATRELIDVFVEGEDFMLNEFLFGEAPKK